MKRLLVLAFVVAATGCDSGAKPHAFRIKAHDDGYGVVFYRGVWPGADAKPVEIGYERPVSVRSPDGRFVAVGGEEALLLIDLVRRRVSEHRFGMSCAEIPILWTRQDRLVFRLWCGDVHNTSRSELLVFDPAREEFVGRRELAPAQHRSTHDGAVLLAPHRGFAQLLRLSADGSVDVTRLPVRAGKGRWPGFAVDSAGRYAYVIGEEDGCARVDLRTRRVDMHRLPHAFDAQPALASKPELHTGTVPPSRDITREARWLGAGKIAVTGSDTWTSNGFDRTAPAGLKILDVRTWTVRMRNPRVFTLRLPWS